MKLEVGQVGLTWTGLVPTVELCKQLITQATRLGLSNKTLIQCISSLYKSLCLTQFNKLTSRLHRDDFSAQLCLNQSHGMKLDERGQKGKREYS